MVGEYSSTPIFRTIERVFFDFCKSNRIGRRDFLARGKASGGKVGTISCRFYVARSYPTVILSARLHALVLIIYTYLGRL